jgi:hypothetical protein
MTDTTTQTKIAAPWVLGAIWENSADGGIDDANLSASDGTAISVFGPHVKEKAHLIAAAPALYEALEAFASCPRIARSTGWAEANEPWSDDKVILGIDDDWHLTVGMIRCARAALRLARGEG